MGTRGNTFATFNGYGYIHETQPFTSVITDNLNLQFMSLHVRRYSDITDIIPIHNTQENFPFDVCDGMLIHVQGIIKTMNVFDPLTQRSHLIMFIEPTIIESAEPVSESVKISDMINECDISGYVCKPVVSRKTPRGVDISDVLLAVNYSRKSTAYIPAIIWDKESREYSNSPVGELIHVTGRFQSRTYRKSDDDREYTAYEISISKVDEVGSNCVN